MIGQPDPRRTENVATTYERLIEEGTFTDHFAHHDSQRTFFASVVGPCLDRLGDGAAVLEAGCGTGVWLEAVADLLGERAGSVSFFGFDLTPGMVELTQRRLGSRASVWVGDVLAKDSYRAGGRGDYDLVFAFDVVQQLPRESQSAALEAMLAHVAPEGTLVVFDHDAQSSYGRTMAIRKRLTGWGIPLLPSFYRVARYPFLGKLARDLAASHEVDVTVPIAPDRRKRALVAIRRPLVPESG